MCRPGARPVRHRRARRGARQWREVRPLGTLAGYGLHWAPLGWLGRGAGGHAYEYELRVGGGRGEDALAGHLRWSGAADAVARSAGATWVFTGGPRDAGRRGVRVLVGGPDGRDVATFRYGDDARRGA